MIFDINSSITANGIGLDGAKSIGEILKTNTTLTQLNLDMIEMNSVSCDLDINSQFPGNKIGPDETKTIAEVLKTNTTLTRLDLGAMKMNHFLAF